MKKPQCKYTTVETACQGLCGQYLLNKQAHSDKKCQERRNYTYCGQKLLNLTFKTVKLER